MNEYTIRVSFSGVAVFDGRMKMSRLKYEGGNLRVYVLGAVSNAMKDKVHYHATSLALAHHIPLTQFRAKGWL